MPALGSLRLSQHLGEYVAGAAVADNEPCVAWFGLEMNADGVDIRHHSPIRVRDTAEHGAIVVDRAATRSETGEQQKTTSEWGSGEERLAGAP